MSLLKPFGNLLTPADPASEHYWDQPSAYFIRRSVPLPEKESIDFHEFMGANGDNESPLRGYWRIILRHRWLIAICALVVSAAVGLHSFSQTPLFTAKSTILIERKRPEVLKVQDARAESFEYDYNNEFYKTQYEILKSPALAERVIRDEGLQDHPLFTGEKKVEKEQKGIMAVVKGAVKNWLGGPNLTAAPATPTGLVDMYLSMLQIKPVNGTGLVGIAFTTSDPQASARLANAHALTYVSYGIDLRSQTNEEATAFLQQKLLELQGRVEESEAALNRYRRDRGIISLDDKQNVVVDRWFDLNKALTAAESEKISLEAQVRAIRERNYVALPVVLNSPVIQSLKSELGKFEAEYASLAKEFKPGFQPLDNLRARIDETRRRIAGEIGSEIKGIESAYAAAKVKETELRARMAEQRQTILNLKDSGVQYGILAREVDTNRQLYDSVLQRIKEMGLAAEIRTSNVYVTGKAQPPGGASFPNKKRNLLMGLIMGLAAGIALAWLLEQLDNTFKSPEEAERYVRLPHLAVVPDFARLNGRNSGYVSRLMNSGTIELASADSEESDKQPMLAQHPLSLIGEAFRTLRSSLLLSQAGGPPHTVLLTSATRGEGKTTTLVNTAIVFAQMGVKVLIIDADLRRPRCHQLLRVENKIGLAEVLAGQEEAEKVIKPTRIDNLYLMPCGATAPNPSELLGSGKMLETLTELSAYYEFIFVDSSPVMAVSDAVSLASMVDGVLVVINGKTPKPLVRKTCARLRTPRVKLLGILLNQVDIRNGEYASYYRYYYDYYGPDTAKEA